MSSNRFLNGSDGGLSLSDLQDGSLSLYINRLKTQGIVEANDYESKTTFSMNDEIQKIDNFTPSTADNTNITGKLHVSNELTVSIIRDPAELTRIELDDTDINIVSQNFTFNGADVPTDAEYQVLKNKTFHIDQNVVSDPPSTSFEGDIVSDGFILRNGPTPAQVLLSDGTTSILNDNEYIILNTPPFNTISDITKSKGDVYYDTTSSSLYGFQPPFRDEPVERTPISYTGDVRPVQNESQFDLTLSELPQFSTIIFTADITFTSARTIPKSIKLTSDTGMRTIVFSSTSSIFNFTQDYVLVEGLRFVNSNTGSSATCITFSSLTASNNYVQNCEFTTGEFAITTSNTQIQIRDNYFYFDGTGDSHRYIALYKNTASTIIARNIFSGNPTSNTACIFISGISGSSFTNGTFVFKQNSTFIQPVQRLCIADVAFGANDNVKFWIHDNNIESSSGFMIFYNPIPMTGVLRIVAYNNVETLGGTATASKGIIACDNITATTLPLKTGKPYITTFNNVMPVLRSDYTGWTVDNNVAYNNTVITTVGNTPKLYSAVLQDVIGGNTSEKTANINLPLEANGTRFLNNLYADKFIIQGGPSSAGYLMSDGTILTSSSTNNNSNIYLYNNNLTTTAPPSAGQIRFNNAVIASTTIVYISHLTRDGTDIDPFLLLISQLSILYIQDQDNSLNFCKFNVNTTPTITPNSYVSVNVTYLEGGGTGANAFPAGMNIFLSIFSNDVEIDSRISNVETKTQNQSATTSGTQFNKNSTYVLRNADADAFVIKSDSNVSRLTVNNTNVIMNGVPLLMQGNRIRDVGAPTEVSDVASIGTLKAGSVPYFTSTNRLSGSAQNLFVQLGNSTIQSAIDAITAGGAVGGSVQVSSGASTENIICVKQNYTLVGAICPNFTQTTQITGNLTIGSSGFDCTRVRISHMKFEGNLIFDNSTFQKLRTYFYNCDWNGTITFPTAAATGTNGTQIFFENCSFSGASAIVIPNQNLYTIFFTRCAFIGQTITNQQSIGNITKTVFSDCSYLPTLSSLGNCILNGPNTTLTTTQANYGSIVLGGTASQLLLGNGGAIPIATYPTMTTGSFAVQWTGGAGGTTVDRTISWRRLSDGISTTVWLTLPTFSVTIGTASNFGVLMTTATVPANLQVANQPHLPIIVNFNGIVQCGWLNHFGSTFGVQPSNKAATVVGQVCGIPNVAIVSYMI